MFTRRGFLKLAGGSLLATLALGGYAFGVEPQLMTRVKRYSLKPPGWPGDLRLRIVALADIHACRPWMPPERIERLVEQANALEPHVIVLLGDYVAGSRIVTDWVPASEWAPALGELKAPLGVHAVLGNHDWWEDRIAQDAGQGPTVARSELEKAGVPVLENDAIRLEKDGKPFWIAGLGDQLALRPGRRWGRKGFRGMDDLDATLEKITDQAPAILLAHEPDIFPKVRHRISLTLSGHTHGGQVRLLGYAPVVPSRFGNRYAYGHVVEDGRHLIVSGGLGCSILPVRFGMPPEIVQIDLGDPAGVA
ncbi:metallophosphoesterase [Mesorhizobium sp. CN2-181]|uniref:metallophosphoesterase n=1 Tax=Mesorhizobium yinganensis TaxID=3157707 RepID=UPI0032B80488